MFFQIKKNVVRRRRISFSLSFHLKDRDIKLAYLYIFLSTPPSLIFLQRPLLKSSRLPDPTIARGKGHSFRKRGNNKGRLGRDSIDCLDAIGSIIGVSVGVIISAACYIGLEYYSFKWQREFFGFHKKWEKDPPVETSLDTPI